MSEIKKIDPVSTGKIAGLIMAIVGFFIGLIVSAISLVMSAVLPTMMSQFSQFEAAGGSSVPFAQMTSLFGLAGVVAIVAFPIIYGIAGFMGGAAIAGIYNFAASRMGGIRIELV